MIVCTSKRKNLTSQGMSFSSKNNVKETTVNSKAMPPYSKVTKTG